jgi:hypothetical protein
MICRHFWLLPLAHGPTVRGRCRNCYEVRDFPASWAEKDSMRAAVMTQKAQRGNAASRRVRDANAAPA